MRSPGAAVTSPRTAAPEVWVLHGQPDSSATWWPARAALLDALAARRAAPVTVRLLDRPGYGHNRRPAAGLAANARWLAGELDRSGAQRVVLVGHSWGGGVAVLAARDPRVAGVALLASIGPGCLLATDRLFEIPAVGTTLAWAALGPGGAVVRTWLRRQVAPHLDDDDRPHARSASAANRTRPVWQSFLVEQRALLAELPAVEAALDRVEVPALVVAGRDDTVIPAATTHALVARLAHVTRVDLEAGHDLNVSAPEPTGRAVADWLVDSGLVPSGPTADGRAR